MQREPGSLPRIALHGESNRTLAELCAAFLREYADKIQCSTARLSEEQVWWRPRTSCNSVGNLVIHLCGNLSLWLLAELGGERFVRHRQAEFQADRSLTRAELLEALEVVIERSRSVIRTLTSADLEKPHHVQGYDLNGAAVLLHAIEHMSYHTGQIVYVVKMLEESRSESLEFYPQHREE